MISDPTICLGCGEGTDTVGSLCFRCRKTMKKANDLLSLIRREEGAEAMERQRDDVFNRTGAAGIQANIKAEKYRSRA